MNTVRAVARAAPTKTELISGCMEQAISCQASRGALEETTMAYIHEQFQHPQVSAFVSTLVSPGTNQVRFSSLPSLDSHLRVHGFFLDWKEPWGAGTMIFYLSRALRACGSGLLVRVKTHGDPPGKPRSFVPHLSVSWVAGGIEYKNELRKYAATGMPEPASPPSGTPSVRNAWGDRTHPVFLHPLPGAASLREDGGNA